MNFLTPLIDFFLPRFCPSCRNKLSVKEEIVCTTCLSKIKHADKERLSHEFERKFSSGKIISGFTSLYVFEKDKELQHIIHGLKYDGKFQIGLYLGKLMGAELGNQFNEWKIDLLIPVPLHHLKRAERGYNQSAYIARGIRSVLKIPIDTKQVRRTRFTETQTNLNLTERRENLKDAFTGKGSNTLKGKTILLLDDVITTGATISECGRILFDKGTSNIYAASVAVAD
ncbi:ComF family protein [bacterium]|nr:ComF family protein [bacterium]